MEAIDWIAELERDNRAAGRRPLKAEIKRRGGDRRSHRRRHAPTASTGWPTAALAIIDYKTGAPPTQKAVDAGFALQLGLLGLIARAGGFDGVSRRAASATNIGR